MSVSETFDPSKVLQFFGGRGLPAMQSATVAECGLTCLAMIAAYHGHKTDLATLRERYPISVNGANLNTLMDIARDLHLSPNAYSLEMEGLKVLKTPCILHWNMNHFVVLKKVGRNHAIIHDPSGGIQRLSLKVVSNAFSGVALELEPEATFRPVEDKKPVLRLRHFWSQIKGLKVYLIQLLLLSLMLQGFALLSPLYIQTVVDQAIGSSNESLLIALVLGFALITLLRAALGLFRGFVSMCMGTSFSFQLNNNLLSHLLRLPLSFFQSRHIGDVLSRFGSLENIKTFLSGNLIAVVLDGVMVVTSLTLMLFYSGWLTTLVFSFALAEFTLRMALFRKIRDITEDQLVAAARTSSNFMETVRAMTGIKIFGRESHRHQIWRALSTERYNLDIRLGRWNLSLGAAREILSGLENTLVIALAAWMVIGGNFTVGMLFAFVAYKGQFLGGIQGLFDKLIEFRMLGLHLERISDIAMAEPERESPENRINIEPSEVRGELELKDISFRYGVGEPWVLQDFDLHLEAGESLALVGPSGCGKTTLMKIAIGLLEPQQGEIRLDGIDITRLGAKQYRKFIGAVMQDDQLLSGSLQDNICFFDPEPDVERVFECSRLASIHDDIMRMPMRYNTLVGDMGSSLSGGQKQRILLARALYPNPKILFLDEATSHLDAENERIASEAIRELEITRLIIAHRKETIEIADRIVRMTPTDASDRLTDVASNVAQHPRRQRDPYSQ